MIGGGRGAIMVRIGNLCLWFDGFTVRVALASNFERAGFLAEGLR